MTQQSYREWLQETYPSKVAGYDELNARFAEDVERRMREQWRRNENLARMSLDVFGTEPVMRLVASTDPIKAAAISSARKRANEDFKNRIHTLFLNAFPGPITASELRNRTTKRSLAQAVTQEELDCAVRNIARHARRVAIRARMSTIKDIAQLHCMADAMRRMEIAR